jgi:coatomer subunit beta
MENVTEQTDYISRIKSIVQLTGYFDPIYAESFVKINKYDVFFEIILVNTSKSNLLNIQVEFSSSTEIMVLEKAQSVNLRPGEMVKLRAHIRFVT